MLYIYPPKLLIASSGPKTGSTLLADMFYTATSSPVYENLMCADMLEVGLSTWGNLTESEKLVSQVSKHFFFTSLRNVSTNLFNDQSIAKTTSFTHLENLRLIKPEVSVINIHRDWKDCSRSLYGFLKHSTSFNSSMSADNVILYVTNKIERVARNLRENDPKVSYQDTLLMSSDKDFRLQKFLEWRIRMPWLKYDLDAISRYKQNADILRLRQGKDLLTDQDYKEIEDAITRYERHEEYNR